MLGTVKGIRERLDGMVQTDRVFRPGDKERVDSTPSGVHSSLKFKRSRMIGPKDSKGGPMATKSKYSG